MIIKRYLNEIEIYDNVSFIGFNFLKFRDLYMGKIKFNPKTEKYYFKFNPFIVISSIDENLIKEINKQIEKLKNEKRNYNIGKNRK